MGQSIIMTPAFLLFGHDTIQVAYYLHGNAQCQFDFFALGLEKERLRISKSRTPKALSIGNMEWLLQTYGSGSGYPLVLENAHFKIECGEFNTPSFFVTYRSQALWQFGAPALHERFMDWAASVGLVAAKDEVLSRVDFTFDYQIPALDFEQNNFVSLASKDGQFREDSKVQTFTFGKGDVMLRIYDKIAEISQQSDKIWFFDLWGVAESVWRIEWQIRKPLLKRFGIRTFADLTERQADVLRYLASEHDTLRLPSQDTNRSRWPLHPLWQDLLQRIDTLDGLGVVREIDPEKLMNERLMRIAISMYGYTKRVAAIRALQAGTDMLPIETALTKVQELLRRVHDPLTWSNDVQTRVTEMRIGQW